MIDPTESNTNRTNLQALKREIYVLMDTFKPKHEIIGTKHL